jgi:hypothetical protein
MILLVLLFGSPIKRKVEVETVGDTNSEKEAWKQGRISDGKSHDSALTEQQKKTSALLHVR